MNTNIKKKQAQMIRRTALSYEIQTGFPLILSIFYRELLLYHRVSIKNLIFTKTLELSEN